MISLITSLYNSEPYLPVFTRRALRLSRRLSKKGVVFEWIIVANEPSARENFFLEKLSTDKNIRIVSVPRENLYASWNRGISLSRGEVIGFWNVDDWRFIGAIMEGAKLLLAGADLVYFSFFVGWFIRIFGGKLPARFTLAYPPKFNKKEFVRSMCCGPFFMFKKDFFERVGPFDEQFKIAGDMDWCIRAAKLSDNFVRAKRWGGVFIVDGAGLSAGANQLRETESDVIYRRHDVVEKISLSATKLLENYRIKEILFKGEWRYI